MEGITNENIRVIGQYGQLTIIQNAKGEITEIIGPKHYDYWTVDSKTKNIRHWEALNKPNREARNDENNNNGRNKRRHR